MAERLIFLDHRVAPEGLYIRGITRGVMALGATHEIFVPRETAELFEWVDPLEEEESAGEVHQVDYKQETRQLRELLQDYYTEVAIGKQLTDAIPPDIEQWELRMDALQKRAEEWLSSV